jgi:hypothetical protein
MNLEQLQLPEYPAGSSPAGSSPAGPEHPAGPVTPEEELKLAAALLEAQAASFQIITDDDYRQAAKLGRTIRHMAEEIKLYFKPLKITAFYAHKVVCMREKKLLTPLWDQEQRLLKLISSGGAGAFGGTGTSGGAGAFGGTGTSGGAGAFEGTKSGEETPPDNVQRTDDWEIVTMQDNEVPIELHSIILRPVNTSRIQRLIRESRGKISIPGVVYKKQPKLDFKQ